MNLKLSKNRDINIYNKNIAVHIFRPVKKELH